MQKTLQEVLVVFALWQVMEKLVDYAYFSKDEYRIAKNVLCGFEQLTVLASGVLGQLFSKIAIKYAQNRFILQAFIKIAMISLLENLL